MYLKDHHETRFKQRRRGNTQLTRDSRFVVKPRNEYVQKTRQLTHAPEEILLELQPIVAQPPAPEHQKKKNVFAMKLEHNTSQLKTEGNQNSVNETRAKHDSIIPSKRPFDKVEHEPSHISENDRPLSQPRYMTQTADNRSENGEKYNRHTALDNTSIDEPFYTNSLIDDTQITTLNDRTQQKNTENETDETKIFFEKEQSISIEQQNMEHEISAEQLEKEPKDKAEELEIDHQSMAEHKDRIEQMEIEYEDRIEQMEIEYEDRTEKLESRIDKTEIEYESKADLMEIDDNVSMSTEIERPETEQPETEHPETEHPETEQPETEQLETEQLETEQLETEHSETGHSETGHSVAENEEMGDENNIPDNLNEQEETNQDISFEKENVLHLENQLTDEQDKPKSPSASSHTGLSEINLVQDVPIESDKKSHSSFQDVKPREHDETAPVNYDFDDYGENYGYDGAELLEGGTRSITGEQDAFHSNDPENIGSTNQSVISQRAQELEKIIRELKSNMQTKYQSQALKLREVQVEIFSSIIVKIIKGEQ
ncbi:hypothetical protein G6F56_008535 [Rhizopus delemar]|uniref:Uncharacterized protein n=1 Tax=Rhizopus stolonifer TaxID=4846 RepID=A0A367IYR5_RHIST|nr:hypothetical protein G6F56_008535 [Rhizopus delemar]RCH82796.1 hypothetical protein CU098_003899 [Rhizopus stolonifer]